MVRCSVLGCKSDSEKKVPGLSFHSYPEDDFLQKKWIDATGRIRWIPKKSSKICSVHFVPDVLIKKKKLTVLLPNAIPILENHIQERNFKNLVEPMATEDFETLDLRAKVKQVNNPFPGPSWLPDVSLVTSGNVDIETTHKQTTGVETTIEPVPAPSWHPELYYITKDDVEIGTTQPTHQQTSGVEGTNSPKYSPRTLKRKWNRTQQQSVERLRKLKALREKCRRLNKKVADFKKIVTELKAKFMITEEDGDLLESIDPLNKDFLRKYLSPQTCGKKFSPALRKFALCLHFISPRAYKYVRQQFNTCLSHPSTLSLWYKSVDANPGFTSESLDCIKLLAQRKEKTLYCALSMDEMAIRKHVQWDGEKCVGLVNYGAALDGFNVDEAREALVFMVTCINDSWKIPVGFFLINGCTGEQKANLVTQCVSLLIECGIVVLTLTYDGCPANFAMAKKLGCKIESYDNIVPYFEVNGHEIAIIPDPAHMLKLVRNCLGQKKVIYNSHNEKISWEYIEKLNDLQENEGLHLANRLKSQHVQFTKQIMKVKLAAQTFSKSVADSIDFCDKDLNLKDFSGSRPTVEFLNKINNLFDIMNSRNLNAYGYKKPITKKNGTQLIDYLNDIEVYIKGLSLLGTPILNTYRKVGFLGFLICISSLKKIYADKILTDELQFLPVYKLSQDHLECFFSSVRSKGGFNNNPTALQFQSAYKRLVVHGEIKSITSGNCIPLEEIKILSHTEMKYEKKINVFTDHIDSENIYITDKNINPDYDHDHDYLPDPTKLSLYTKEIIPYIGGFVIRKIKRTLKCEDCLLALVDVKYAGLIFKKDKGGLIYPSRDVVKICSIAEKLLKQNLQKGITFFAEKKIIPQLILATLKECQSILITSHFIEQPLIGNHRILLIKAITSHYLNVRIHHATKMFQPQEKIRNFHNKLVLFQGQ